MIFRLLRLGILFTSLKLIVNRKYGPGVKRLFP